MNRQRSGFTLIEMLVVIAIISALAGLLIPTVHYARLKNRVSMAAQDIQRLSLALEAYSGDWGDYPPTSLEDALDVPGNGIDSGIESLVAHLASRRKGGPYLTDLPEDQLTNLDGDHLTIAEVLEQLNWLFGDDQLRELVDPFGNPYVYIHNRDYENAYTVHCVRGEKTTTVQAGMSPKTATYYAPLNFQIWSMGPDGKNAVGAGEESGDDIGSWR